MAISTIPTNKYKTYNMRHKIHATPKPNNKRGFLFSILTIILLIIVMVVVSGRSALEFAESKRVVASEIATADNLINQLTSSLFMSKIVTSPSYHTFQGLVYYVNKTGPLQNQTQLNELFREGLLNGTFTRNDIASDPYNFSQDYPLQFRSLTQIMNTTIQSIANTFALETSFVIDPDKIFVYHITPWQIAVDANIVFNLQGQTVSYINLAVPVRTVFDITDATSLSFIDPFLYYKTNGMWVYNITKYGDGLYTSQGANTLWNEILFAEYVNDNSNAYVRYDGAPSYLQRFTTNLSANPGFGIHTILNATQVQNLSDVGVLEFTGSLPTNRPYFDTMYFNTSYDCTLLNNELYNVTGTDVPDYLVFTSNQTQYFLNDSGNTNVVCS